MPVHCHGGYRHGSRWATPKRTLDEWFCKMGLKRRLQQAERELEASLQLGRERLAWLNSDERARLILKRAPTMIVAAVGGDEGPGQIAGRPASLIRWRRREVAAWELARYGKPRGGTAWNPEEWTDYRVVYLTTDGKVVVREYNHAREISKCVEWNPDGRLPSQLEVLKSLESMAQAVGADLDLDGNR